MKTIIVTRHIGLVEYLRENCLCPPDAEVIEHATPEQITGNRVIGLLPLHLAALADSVVHVPLSIPIELRGVELSLEQVRQMAGKVREFRVTEIPLGG